MDKSKCYRVLGLPNGSGEVDVKEMYRRLNQSYTKLLKEGKIDVSVLNELNMAYYGLITSDDFKVLRNIMLGFVDDNNAIIKLVDLGWLLNILAKEPKDKYSLNTALMLALGDYAGKLADLMAQMTRARSKEELMTLVSKYPQIEQSFMSDFSISNSYYGQALSHMSYGVIATKEVCEFNASLRKCQNSLAIIKLLVSSIGFLLKLSNADEEMKRLYANINLVNIGSADDETVEKMVADKMFKLVTQNKFSLERLVNFYRSGEILKLKKEVIDELGLDHKLKKKL